ncbi:hypothetical protein [Subtercola sp. YIM 133946]|uniref:hypothetical protein n=1 Tax=Subtercola sp. YIM 133946 TaxID=3118909 RepID=UPI002F944821
MVDEDDGAAADEPSRSTSTHARAMKRRQGVIGVVVAAIIVVLIVVVVSVSIAQGGSTGTDQSSDQIPPVVTGSGAPSGDASSVSPSDPASSDPGAVPTAPVEAAPVPIDSPATSIPGLTFAISSMQSVEGTATAVGEVAGPSIQFTVTATNTTGDPISLETTVVNVTYGDAQTPADSLSTGTVPIPPVVEAGASAAGTYIFNVPLDQRGDLRVSVDYQVGTPIVVFEGAGPQ